MSETDLFRNNLDAVVAALVDDDTLNEPPRGAVAVAEPVPHAHETVADSMSSSPPEPVEYDAPSSPHEGAPAMSASTDRLRALLGDSTDAGDTAVLPTPDYRQPPTSDPVHPEPAGPQLREIHGRLHDDDDEYTYGSASVDDDDYSESEAPGSAPSTRGKFLDAARRHPRRTALIAAAVLIVVVGAFVLTSGSDSAPAPAPAYRTPAVAAPTTSAGSAGATNTGAAGGGDDQPIKVAAASSRCPAGSTNPMQAFDDNLKTAWQCVRTLGIDGQVLQVNLGGSYVVSSISIVPGFNAVSSDQTDQWPRHRTVARVKYTFNDPDRTSLTQVTNNLRNEVITRVTPPVLATRVTITILGTTAPTGPAGDDSAAGNDAKADTDDFAVSEIHVVGHKPN